MPSQPSASDPRSSERSDRNAQANHVLAHLQAQLAELDRREQHLNQQLSTLLEQQRLTQKETHRSQARALELNQLDATLTKEKTDLDRREENFKIREEKLSARLDEFLAEKSEFESAQTAREHTNRKEAQQLAERELRVGQQELEARRERAELDKRSSEVQRSQHDCAVAQTRLAEEQAEFENKRSEFEVEISIKRAEFEAEINAKRAECESEISTKQAEVETEISTKRAEFEAEISKKQAEFEAHRDQTTLSLDDRNRAATELDQELDQRLLDVTAKEKHVERSEVELKQQYEKLEQERRTLKADVGAEVQSEREAVAHALQQIKIQMTSHEARVNEWEAKIQTEQATHTEKFNTLRKEKLSALDQREKELERREIDIEKRKQFHERHLDKIRTDLQTKKVELERDRQQHRVWVEQVEQSIRMRLAHMRRFRDLVGQRELALQEEQSAFQKSRAITEVSLTKLRERLLHERQQWNHQRAADLQRLTKRDQNLDQQFENIHKSRLEIDQLRTELKTGLANFVESLQTADDATSAESDQLEMSQHFHGLLQVVGRQCDELESAQHLFSKRQQKIREEGTALAVWIQEKEQHLEGREEQVQDDVETLKLQEQLWQAARDQWNSDRLQAESVIRELVIQLETALDEIANLQSEIGNEELAAPERSQRSAA